MKSIVQDLAYVQYMPSFNMFLAEVELDASVVLMIREIVLL